ncbi:MurR/RpiR family transcriptional regulator [Pseudonocardia acaciae]|uniref:MurR/RpiR family transcriptional regulator n=1 Tax=Pseudonocardia acaciae TaxID=551276 RepID=UPI001FDFF2E5|nr:MurR/RpiR family transcriptional regulator [Pseudonocardia acaciae]
MDNTNTRVPPKRFNPEAPANYPQLREVLQDRLPTLAPGQQRIARLLLDDPEGTSFRSIGETARLAEVHSSSVVRFAGLLGLAGYPALVRLCREQLAMEAHLVRRLEQAKEHTETTKLLGAIAENDTRNLTRTFARIDRGDWERAVSLLRTARVVHVVGMRKCYSVAHLLTYLLHMVRPGVRQIGGAGGLLVDELRELAADDVLVAVSIRRYTRDTVRAVEFARQHGVATIALTDDPSSPLARAASLTFYLETGSVTVLRSLSTFTAVVQALATSVAVSLGKRGRDELRTDESLLESFAVYSPMEAIFAEE